MLVGLRAVVMADGAAVAAVAGEAAQVDVQFQVGLELRLEQKTVQLDGGLSSQLWAWQLDGASAMHLDHQQGEPNFLLLRLARWIVLLVQYAAERCGRPIGRFARTHGHEVRKRRGRRERSILATCPAQPKRNESMVLWMPVSLRQASSLAAEIRCKWQCCTVPACQLK